MLELGVPPAMVMLIALILLTVEGGVNASAFDVVEMFAGQQAITRACRQAALSVASMDLRLHRGHDILCAKGFGFVSQIAWESLVFCVIQHLSGLQLSWCWNSRPCAGFSGSHLFARVHIPVVNAHVVIVNYMTLHAVYAQCICTAEKWC